MYVCIVCECVCMHMCMCMSVCVCACLYISCLWEYVTLCVLADTCLCVSVCIADVSRGSGPLGPLQRAVVWEYFNYLSVMKEPGRRRVASYTEHWSPTSSQELIKAMLPTKQLPPPSPSLGESWFFMPCLSKMECG